MLELSRLMSLTDMVGVVSPPYFSQVAYQDKEFIRSIAEDKSQRYRDGRLKGHFATPEAIRRYAEKIMETYSLDPRNIGNLPDTQLAGVISPPYGEIDIGKGIRPNRWEKVKDLDGFRGRKEWESGTPSEYSSNPDNIGNLKDVPLVGIMSPPFLEAQTGGGIAIKGYEGKYYYDQGNPDRVGERCGYVKARQGTSEGQIGNLPDKPLVGITSPPYVIDNKNVCHTREGKTLAEYDIKRGFKPTAHQTTDYSTNPLNIGNIPDRPLVGVTSPPFEDSTIKKEFKTEGELEEFAKQQYVFKHGRSLEATKRFIEKSWRGYSDSENNIGNQEGESYLSAMFKVYQQAFLCGISPLVVVTKNPTRNGKLRRLDLDTISLLQLCGYEIFDYHRAILFESHKQETLDGDTKDVHKGRISFFKRLSLEKGTTVAQWEDVIFARIPRGG